MSAYLTYIKIAAAALFVALVAYLTWYATSDHYEKIIADKQVETDRAVLKQLEENQQLRAAKAALRKSAEEDHAKNQLAINDLTAQLSGVHIHIPSGYAVSQAGTGSEDPNGGGGILSERVDAAFERLQARAGQLFQRCDQINIDAKQTSAVSQ